MRPDPLIGPRLEPEAVIVQLSGGVTSWAAGRLAVDEYGPARVRALFADVKGDATSPHLGEDEDTYRFLEDSAAELGVELIRVSDGRDIWRVFRDERFIGNNRIAPCSKLLKQAPARRWVREHTDPDRTLIVLGIDGLELDRRIPGQIRGWAPWRVDAPLAARGITKLEAMRRAEAAGLTLPRMYAAGFEHANCGGYCVRAGQAQNENLLREHPDRYAFHEAQEQKLRAELGADVAAMAEVVNGRKVPLTLQTLRERLEDQPGMFDPLDVGGCGCMMLDDEEDV